MENLVVTTFQNIQDATEGLNRLKELDQLSDISIYNILMVRKTTKTQYELLYYEGVDIKTLPPDNEMVDLLFSTVDGPIRMAIAIFSGLIKGNGSRDDSKNFPIDFLEQFNNELQLDTFTILLDVEEDNEFAIDGYMKPYRGVALRTNIVDIYYQYVVNQWLQIQKQIASRKEILSEVGEEYRDELKWRIDQFEEKKEWWIGILKVQMLQIVKQISDRINMLERKMNSVEGNAKAKLKSQKENLEKKVAKFNYETTEVFVRPDF
jgi:hypothetical protein